MIAILNFSVQNVIKTRKPIYIHRKIGNKTSDPTLLDHGIVYIGYKKNYEMNKTLEKQLLKKKMYALHLIFKMHFVLSNGRIFSKDRIMLIDLLKHSEQHLQNIIFVHNGSENMLRHINVNEISNVYPGASFSKKAIYKMDISDITQTTKYNNGYRETCFYSGKSKIGEYHLWFNDKNNTVWSEYTSLLTNISRTLYSAQDFLYILKMDIADAKKSAKLFDK